MTRAGDHKDEAMEQRVKSVERDVSEIRGVLSSLNANLVRLTEVQTTQAHMEDTLAQIAVDQRKYAADINGIGARVGVMESVVGNLVWWNRLIISSVAIEIISAAGAVMLFASHH